jgi:hypothetical protein
MGMLGRGAAVAWLFVVVVATPALAGDDVAAAEALFDRGLADMNAGRFATGCPAIEESYRLDPRPGTLFTLAECQAKWGHFATASARYDDYLAAYERLNADQQAKQRERPKVAKAQKAALAEKIPHLTLTLPAGAPKGTVVVRDDVELAAPALGIPLPVDPGDHTIVVRAPGRPPSESRITLAPGEKKEIALEVKAAPIEKSATAGDASSGEASGGLGPLRIAGIAVGSLGLAGIIAGAVTGGMALSAKGVVDDNCVDLDCNSEGKAAADRGKTLALVSTIGFGVGIAGVVAGTVLVAIPARKTSQTSVGLLAAGENGAVLGMRGVW